MRIRKMTEMFSDQVAILPAAAIIAAATPGRPEEAGQRLVAVLKSMVAASLIDDKWVPASPDPDAKPDHTLSTRVQ
jgi:hypothetical protein